MRLPCAIIFFVLLRRREDPMDRQRYYQARLSAIIITQVLNLIDIILGYIYGMASINSDQKFRIAHWLVILVFGLSYDIYLMVFIKSYVEVGWENMALVNASNSAISLSMT